ncbi:hypothetical protein ACFQX6_35955 [Streptosporangium lutulentum]
MKSPAAADVISRPSSTLSAPAEPSRVTVALRRAGIAVAGVGVAALTAAACVLSFEDLRTLAVIGEARPDLAYLYPAAFDALVVIAMISVLLLRGGWWPVRLQAGAILTLLFAAAATAEVTTAMRTTTAVDVRQAAIVVAVSPWVILVVALWLWLLLIKHAAARRTAVDEALPDHERDIVPFPDTNRPTAEYPAQPEWRDRPSRPDRQVHPDPLQHGRPAQPVRHEEPLQREEPVRRDRDDPAVRPDRQASSTRPGQLVHHPAAEIMLDPQAAPPMESAPHHDLPASVPVVGPTPAPETPEVTEIPAVPPLAKPMRWGDLVRPRQGDMLVHPPRPAPEAVQERQEEARPGGRVSERVRTWDADIDSPEEEPERERAAEESEVGDRDADTQPIRTMSGQATDRTAADRAADRTADETAGDTAGESSPDLAHGAEAADPGEGLESGSREKDTVAPPSGRMRSTPVPPGE